MIKEAQKKFEEGNRSKHKERYIQMIDEGKWHDHPENWNHRAWCYIISYSDRFFGSKYNFFQNLDNNDDPSWKWIAEYMKSDSYNSLSSGEFVIFNLAAHLYSKGKISFDITTMYHLDTKTFNMCLDAIRISEQGLIPYAAMTTVAL